MNFQSSECRSMSATSPENTTLASALPSPLGHFWPKPGIPLYFARKKRNIPENSAARTTEKFTYLKKKTRFILSRWSILQLMLRSKILNRTFDTNRKKYHAGNRNPRSLHRTKVAECNTSPFRLKWKHSHRKFWIQNTLQHNAFWNSFSNLDQESLHFAILVATKSLFRHSGGIETDFVLSETKTVFLNTKITNAFQNTRWDSFQSESETFTSTGLQKLKGVGGRSDGEGGI